MTYVDNIFGTSGAPAVANLTTVNGVTVSTVNGGCYTTPYYYYSYTYTEPVKTGQKEECDSTWQGGCDGSWNRDTDTCSGGWVHSNCRMVDTYTDVQKTGYAYGASTSGTNPQIIATYYTKSCGMENGQLLSATIVY